MTVPENIEPTRDQAWDLFCEWTESDSLRKHALAVEACMRAYARIWGEDEERYAVTSTTSATRISTRATRGWRTPSSSGSATRRT